MTSQGSAFTRLRRALDHGSLTNALAAAAELETVGLREALELVILFHADDRGRYGRAAVRWHARYETEIQPTLAQSQAVLAALAAMQDEAWQPAAAALAELLSPRREFTLACSALVAANHTAATR
jgi:hypothetical protein